ncbi:MAG: mechanosensitive ion channel family protein [Rubrobacter sp.]|jgi:small-conductance mechanosensitive channel|nr:mechanosensitive ion channel family protein [Rubrobacter sp.]
MTEATGNSLSIVGDFIPRLLGAAVVLLVAFVAAQLLQGLLARLLRHLRLDELSERTGATESLWKLGYGDGPSRLLGLVLFWGVMLTGLAGALSALGLSSLQQTMSQVVNLSGQALVALVILLAGVMSAGWLSGLVAREAERAGLRGMDVFRRVTFAAVIAVAALLAAGQLGLETSVLVLLAVVALATLGLTTALALGPGLVPLSGNIAAGRYVQEDLAVGEEISVEGVEGTVEELGHASVTLRSEDGYLYRIPNRTILESIVRKKA